MKQCSQSEKSSFEIESKLKIWGLQDCKEEIISLLRKENFLDDTRYVKAYVHDKIFINKWGRIKVRYYLHKTGIKENIIENELMAIDIQLYKKIISDELNRKKTTLKKYPPMQRKSRLLAFGNQRGYEFEYIRDFIENVN
jgi:regulatory protein